MPNQEEAVEEAVEAVVFAIAQENYWDADAPEVARGLKHLAETYVAAAEPFLRSQIERELGGRLLPKVELARKALDPEQGRVREDTARDCLAALQAALTTATQEREER